MKKMVCMVLVILLLIAICCGCHNRTVIDTTRSFETAYIALPNGESVVGEVQSWKHWDDSDMIQVKVDGVTYYTHSTNVVLISE